MTNLQASKLLELHSDYITEFIKMSLKEDIGSGDHTTLSTVAADHKSSARLVSKDEGIWAGSPIVEMVANHFDSELKVDFHVEDGRQLQRGDLVYEISGPTKSILTTERLILNFVQHLSGVATQTNEVAKLIEDLPTQLLDTRKTTPGLRILEKWAVAIGGGTNHRYGLYDLVMIKDNHVDQCGSITIAVERCCHYLKEKNLDLKIEVETRSLEEVREVMKLDQVDWVMLDNFEPDLIREALEIIGGQKITEASGGIKKENIRAYAETGVDFISSGSLTQSAQALDLSLKMVK